MKKFPFYKQLDAMDCGPTCLRMVSHFYGKIYSQDFLREKTSINKNGASLSGIAEAAELIGLQSLSLTATFETLANDVPFPCIVYWKQRHFLVVISITRKTNVFNPNKNTWKVKVADPAHGVLEYGLDDFLKGWINKKRFDMATDEGIVLALEPTPEFYELDLTTNKNKNKVRISRIIGYFKPYKKIILQLFIGLLVSSFIQLSFPFLMQSIIDVGVNYKNIQFVYILLAAQLMLFLSETTVQLFRGWLLLHMTSRIKIKLLTNFLAKLMSLPIHFFDSKNIGDLMQRIQDNSRLENFLSNSTLNTFFSFFTLAIFGVILMYFNWMVFAIFISFAILQIIWTLSFLKRRAEIDYKRFDQAAGNQSSTLQLIYGMQEIRINGSEKRRRWEWEAVQTQLFKISIKGLALAQTQNTGGAFFNEFKNILITFYAAKSVIDGNMTLGTMLSIQYIIGQLNLPISNFISFVQAAQDAKMSLNRLNDIYEKENEDPVHEQFFKELPLNRSIFIKNLSFKYGSRGSDYALKKINLSIPEGKITAIVGESGSGKTTLIKLLLKFYEPTEGSITVGNTPLNQISSKFWRSECGCVMQEGYIFSDSILRNVTESDSDGVIDKERLLYSLNTANLIEWIDSLPSGYHTRIGASGLGISGGQQQRILIARAIYKNPEYLLLDEATSALDANNESGIMTKLEDFFSNRTVVIVAHRLSTVKNADHIIVINKGEVVEEGTHAHLIAKGGHYYSLIKNQLELGN